MTNIGIARRTLVGSVGLLAFAPVSAIGAAARPRVAIRTSLGDIVIELEAGKAPLTSANFLHYVDAGKYDNGSFYRATRTPGTPTEGTVVAGPAPRVRPFPPVAHESTTVTGLRHVNGTVSLGRFAPGSATDTFFICLGPEPYLDANPAAKGDNLGYAAFGHVVQGLAVVQKIHARRANGPSPFPDQKGQWLSSPVVIKSMRRVS